MKHTYLSLLLFFSCLVFSQPAYAGSGSEGAAFLDIPVGAGPAALGSAYTAHATDAYATVWNPAGLGFLEAPELAGMHLSYLVSTRYEFVGTVAPLGKKTSGLGLSAQMFSSGDIPGRDELGNPAPSYETSFGAYTLAYGRLWGEKNSFGAAAKLIQSKLVDVTANAYAMDFGFLRRHNDRLDLGAAISNVGSDIKFVQESDPLAASARAGARYQVAPGAFLLLDGVMRRTRHWGVHAGYEWFYKNQLVWRVGYNSSRLKTLPVWSGISTGLGLFFLGQEFSYAWVPYGDLGSTHYLSLGLRWSREGRTEERTPRMSRNKEKDATIGSGYDAIFEMLSEEERKQVPGGAP